MNVTSLTELKKSTWKVTASTTMTFNDELQIPENAIDGVCRRGSLNVFISGRKSMDWLQIEFPRRVEAIKGVVVSKRTISDYAGFSDVELRIGNRDESGQGVVQLSGNPLVGRFDGPVHGEKMAVFQLAERPESGKFLTLQRISGRLTVDEVFINI